MTDCVSSANIVQLAAHRAKAISPADCSYSISGNGEFREFGEFISPAPQSDIHCELSLLINNQGYATKVFDVDDEGELRKRSAANIYEGRAKRIAISNLEDLLHLIESLPSAHALCFGVTEKDEATILTQETLRAGSYPNAVARDRNHFAFREGQPGIMMFDCDARPDKPPLNWQDIDQVIGQIIPDWFKTQRLWRASSSAFLYNRDGSELIGVGGWRCYVMVDDASAIPAVGAFFYQHLWEMGHGYIRISQSGQALDRSLIDASVWQPERVDFAAPPVLSIGLERRPPKPELLGSVPVLATASIKAPLTLGEWRREAEVLRKAKEEVKPQCRKVRRAYVTERVEALKREFPKTSEKRLQTLVHRAAKYQVLSSDFVLYRPDGGGITVGEILADPDKWHEARFADPLEPDYRNDKRIAYANLEPNPGDDPFIWSHAHGGMSYRLVRESAALTLKKGERPRVLDGSLAIIRGRGELFERGGEMVRIASDIIRAASDVWLGDYLGRHIQFKEMKFQKGEWIEFPADPPTWLCQQINAKSGERGLRELNGIITAPTLRPDGSLLCAPGYDETTGLLLRGSGWPRISETPTEAELHAAYKTLWTPFAEFPFVTKEDRGVMLAALLTGIVRRNLPRAPAFSFDAPAAGSGKTLLGQCLLRLCGTTPTVIPECRDEEELRKRLLAALKEGKPGLLLDNIRGSFGSAPLEAFLTAEYYADRILGVSTMLTLRTNVLFLISGNTFIRKGTYTGAS